MTTADRVIVPIILVISGHDYPYPSSCPINHRPQKRWTGQRLRPWEGT